MSDPSPDAPTPLEKTSLEKTSLENDLGLPIPESMTPTERALLNRVRDLEKQHNQSPWVGRVAMILCIGVSVTMIALAVPAFIPHDSVSSEEATTLATVLGAAIGGLGVYLGTRDHRK